MIGFRQGKDVTFEIAVVDAVRDPISLALASAVFSYALKSDANAEATVKECTINDNIISVDLTSAETAVMLGVYELEIKLKDSLGKIDPIYNEDLTVIKSRIPTYPV